MQPPHQHSRINTTELKAQLVKKLGPDGSKQYFYYLNRFLSLKISKVELSKFCLRILGRENIALHNQLILSILRNTCNAKSPPSSGHEDGTLKHGTKVGDKGISADGYLQNGSHNGVPRASGSPGLLNGVDMLPVSPRKARTGRRTGDFRRPNGRASFATATQSGDVNVRSENGDLNSGRSLHHHEGLVPQVANERENLGSHHARLSGMMRSPVDRDDFVVMDDGKDVWTRSPLQAPLGVPNCTVSIGGARRAFPPDTSSKFVGACNGYSLLDSLSLRERMEQIAVAQGLQGVSMDCANILNHGLDSYVKGLIASCIELVGARSENELLKNKSQVPHTYRKLINGVRPGHHYQKQNSGKLPEVQQLRTHGPISLQNFRVAMEMNPRQLGEDWPLLLEKICTRAFEE